MATGWPLPDEVAQVAAGVVQSNRISNFGLLFQRYLKYLTERKIRGNDKSTIWQRDIVDRSKYIYQSLDKLQIALQNRTAFLQNSLRSMKYHMETFERKVVWRLSIGFGTASALETGLTLHRIHGIPYLPGSAVKGVTRDWKMQQIADALSVPRLSAEQIVEWETDTDRSPTPWKQLEKLLTTPIPDNPKPEEQQRLRKRWEVLQDAFKGKRLELLRKWGFIGDGGPTLNSLEPEAVEQCFIRGFSRTFGSMDAQGEVIFFDAYPTSLIVQGRSVLALDIINSHYQDYYQGDQPPADWLSPNPVYFLTVRAGTPFRFCLAAKDDELLTDAKNWLIQALQDNGIGAKTRAGYGEMGEVSSKPLAPAAPGSAAVASEKTKISGEQLLDALAESQEKQPAKKILQSGDKVDAEVIENTDTQVTVRLVGANNEEITFDQAYYPKAVGDRVKLKIRQIDAQGRIRRVGP